MTIQTYFQLIVSFQMENNEKLEKSFLENHWGKIVLTGGLSGLLFVELAHYYDSTAYLVMSVILIFGSLAVFLKTKNSDK